jgi:hypothetical protein
MVQFTSSLLYLDESIWVSHAGSVGASLIGCSGLIVSNVLIGRPPQWLGELLIEYCYQAEGKSTYLYAII